MRNRRADTARSIRYWRRLSALTAADGCPPAVSAAGADAVATEFGATLADPSPERGGSGSAGGVGTTTAGSGDLSGLSRFTLSVSLAACTGGRGVPSDCGRGTSGTEGVFAGRTTGDGAEMTACNGADGIAGGRGCGHPQPNIATRCTRTDVRNAPASRRRERSDIFMKRARIAQAMDFHEISLATKRGAR